MLAAHDPNPMHHVQDSSAWEFFDRMAGDKVELQLPHLFGFQITKFMLLELLAAGLILAIYIPLARRAANGALPKRPLWNCFESLPTFIRNEGGRPNLREPDSPRVSPFPWDMLFSFRASN